MQNRAQSGGQPTKRRAGDHLVIGHEDLADAALLRLSGEVDMADAALLKDALTAAAASVRNVILDCSELGYIDSSGFAVLFRAHRALNLRGGQLVIAAASANLQQAFGIIGLNRHIRCVESVDAAVAIVNGEH